MKFQLVALISLSLFFTSLTCRARSEPTAGNAEKWEIWSGSLADFTTEFESQRFSVDLLGRFRGVAPTIGYYVSDSIELLMTLGFSFETIGSHSGEHDLYIMAGTAFNLLGSKLSDSFYAKLLLGFDDMFSNKVSEVSFTLKNIAWSVGLGKRFELTSTINYSPEVNLKVTYEAQGKFSQLSIVPLQFSLVF